MDHVLTLGRPFRNLSLEELEREPQRLRHVANELQERGRALSLDNYRLHLAGMETGQRLGAEAREYAERGRAARRLAHTAKSVCESVSSDTNKLVQEQRRVGQAMQEYSTLAELLGIPQLAETCARHGGALADAALDLSEFTEALRSRQQDSGGLVATIADTVDGEMRKLHEELVESLESPKLSLPQALRDIGALRRWELQRLRAKFPSQQIHLEAVEEHLQDIFLVARGAAEEKALRNFTVTPAHQYMVRVLDFVRSHWVETTSLFAALFLSGSDRTTPLVHLRTWMLARTQSFGSWFGRHSGRLDGGAAVAAVAEAAEDTRLRLQRRLGWEIRTIAVPLLRRRVRGLLEERLAKAAERFALAVLRGRWASEPAWDVGADVAGERRGNGSEETPDDAGAVERNAQDAKTGASPQHGAGAGKEKPATMAAGGESSRTPVRIPRRLLSFPPLARAANALAETGNELRRCVPLLAAGELAALAESWASDLQRCGQEAADRHVAFAAASAEGFSEQEAAAAEERAQSMGREFRATFVPFLEQWIEHMTTGQ